MRVFRIKFWELWWREEKFVSEGDWEVKINGKKKIIREVGVGKNVFFNIVLKEKVLLIVLMFYRGYIRLCICIVNEYFLFDVFVYMNNKSNNFYFYKII